MLFGKGIDLLAAGLCLALCAACGGGGGSAGASGPGAPALSSHPTTLSLLAGSAADAGSADGAGAAARFNRPTGIALDAAGNAYVADHGNCVIRKITPAGAVSTLAGAAGRCTSQDGAGGAAGFFYLGALAIGPDGTLYAADGLKMRAITPAGAASTVATLETGSQISGSDVEYFYAEGVAVDRGGNLVVTNGAGTRKISPAGATTILDGAASLDTLVNVWSSHAYMQRGLAADSAGTLWIANADNTITTIDAAGKQTRIAGMSGGPGYQDGTGSDARFVQVVALAPDGAGNAYAADAVNNVIRRITPGGVVTSVAGATGATSLQLGSAPGGLPALAGVTADGKGTLVAISGNAIVKIVLP